MPVHSNKEVLNPHLEGAWNDKLLNGSCFNDLQTDSMPFHSIKKVLKVLQFRRRARTHPRKV